MNKFELIEALEGTYAPNLTGQYFPIKNGAFCLPIGDYNLTLYEYGQLEVMYQKSISRRDIERFNKARCEMLHRPSDNPQPVASQATLFSRGKNRWEVNAIRHFNRLSPEERTELLGQMYEVYSIWFNDQQKELAKVAG